MAARFITTAALALVAFCPVPRASAFSSKIDAPIRTILAIGPEGRGNASASTAVKSLSQASVDSIPEILAAMDGANDYALNWLRSAIETIVQRETGAGRHLHLGALEEFVANKKHHPRARRLAYDLIGRTDAGRARQMLPGFVNDPSPELRYEAVQQIADRAESSITTSKPKAIGDYRLALGYAREAGQIDKIAAKLGELGEKVDFQKTFGWVNKWKVVGPFDNSTNAGFAKAYPPENSIDLTAEYDGKTSKVKWQDYITTKDHGEVDLNQPLTMTKAVAGYAYSEFWSDTARTAQVRLGSQNGWKVWFNGRYLFGRDEYHRADEIDQFRLPVELKPGKNIILVKCLQNEQTEDWAKDWQFMLRITDEEGTPIFSTK